MKIGRFTSVLGLVLSTTVNAQNASDLEHCSGAQDREGDRIAACSRAIDLGTPSPIDLGLAYFSRGLEWTLRGEYDRAISDFDKALELNPRDALVLTSRGRAWSRKGRPENALADFSSALRIEPNDAPTLISRGIELAKVGKLQDAIDDYNRAIRLEPTNTFALLARAEVLYRSGSYDSAIADFTSVVHADPKNFLAFMGRGNAWARKNNFDRAIADYSETLQLNPQELLALRYRAITWAQKREYGRAIADFNILVRSQQNNTDAYGMLAWLLATSPKKEDRDGKRAMQLAIRATEASNWRDIRDLEALAAANAEIGNFTEAIRWQQQVVTLLTPSRNTDHPARQRLEFYKIGQPWREPVN